MGIDAKKAAIAAALIFVGMKSFSKNKTADSALIALGAVTLVKSIPAVAVHLA